MTLRMETVRIDLGPRSYDIYVGINLLAEAGRHIASLLPQPRVIILTDTIVQQHHGALLVRSLEAAGIRHDTIVLPPGEATKSLDRLSPLLSDLLDLKPDRSTTLLAFGGGVIGDLAGFAAAILLRGVPFIQIPTTLLAQVDSSVGGKTGIDMPQGKNLVGAFHQPRLVLADLFLLETLPRRQLLAGYAEIVKYGLIGRPAFFSWLEGHGVALLEGDLTLRRQAVVESCRAKAEVVAADECEAGHRALLNLGHTFGHALEAEVGFSDELLHGEAVAVGLAMAFGLSVRLGLCPADAAGRVERHLAAVGLPTGLADLPLRLWQPESLLAHMQADKKMRAGRLTFVLARNIGEAFLSREVGAENILDFWEEAVVAATSGISASPRVEV